MTDGTPGRAPPSRVVMLDVDGPMIPSTFVLADRGAGRERRFPVTTIAVVNELCARSGAAIVLNTTHAEPRPGVPDIVDALLAHGVLPGHIHPTDPVTLLPRLGRHGAVLEWLGRHPEVGAWVGFDNEVYTQADELVWVDPDSGLTLSHLNQALTLFGCPEVEIHV